MRSIILLTLGLVAASMTQAQNWEDQKRYVNGAGANTLRILSSTDAIYLAPVMEAFAAQYDDIAVEYLVTGTSDIYDIMQDAPKGYDVVISSAMDLQIKLVNDGGATAIPDLPAADWSHWRGSLFGFTAEPAAIVVNKAAFANRTLPQTRQDLISLLRAEPDFFQDKLATYDIRRSGLGYLFAAQDARTSETFWRLTEVMGGLGTKLFCCSGAMIDAVSNGDILVAYNVLGSYAAAQAQLNDQIEVIIPSDFATTMMRTVFVAKNSASPDLAKEFVRFMLEASDNPAEPDSIQLPGLALQAGDETPRLIPLEPSLMIYLDRIKRRAFTKEWESAVIQ